MPSCDPIEVSAFVVNGVGLPGGGVHILGRVDPIHRVLFGLVSHHAGWSLDDDDVIAVPGAEYDPSGPGEIARLLQLPVGNEPGLVVLPHKPDRHAVRPAALVVDSQIDRVACSRTLTLAQ